MFVAATLVLSLFSSPPAAPLCAAVTPPMANRILGATARIPEQSAAEEDEDIPGAMRSTCVYTAGTRMLIVMEHTFKDAKAAREAITQEAIRARHEDETGLTIKEETGVGDKAYWVTLKTGAEYVVIKGAKVMSVIVGGVDKSPAELQPRLKEAALAALARN